MISTKLRFYAELLNGGGGKNYLLYISGIAVHSEWVLCPGLHFSVPPSVPVLPTIAGLPGTHWTARLPTASLLDVA